MFPGGSERCGLRLWAGTGARAGQIVETVTVFLSNTAIVPSQVMFVSQNLAARMFVSTGVRIVWRLGGAADLRPGRDRAIVVRLATDTPANYLPGVLAYALPYQGNQIAVLYNRVEQVQEITHILQGINRHSDSGVMKAHWDRDDYMAMAESCSTKHRTCVSTPPPTQSRPMHSPRVRRGFGPRKHRPYSLEGPCWI